MGERGYSCDAVKEKHSKVLLMEALRGLCRNLKCINNKSPALKTDLVVERYALVSLPINVLGNIACTWKATRRSI